MQAHRDSRRIVESHFGFIGRLGARLRAPAWWAAASGPEPLLKVTPGLQQLFDSIVTASPTPRLVKDRAREEWNPLSQRMLLSDEAPIPAAALEADFSLVPTYAQTFVEWSHEAVHILAMEPWYCGDRAIGPASEFIDWCLAAEALAFWYADIVVTRAIRRAVPTADLVYCRSAVSNTGFHPEEAFRALGIETAEEMLPIYIAAFLGRGRELRDEAHPVCVTLAERIQEFYSSSQQTLRGLYELLTSFDLLSGFRARFCGAPDLPSLFEDKARRALVHLDIAAYHRMLGTSLLPELAALTPDRLSQVRARRALQTRAYFAWMVAHSLRRGWVFTEHPLDVACVRSAVEVYLAGLEAGLRDLAHGRGPDGIEQAASVLDRAYEEEVRGPLDSARAYMRYRYRIFPYFAPTGGVVGLWDERTQYTREEAEAVARFAFERSAWSPEIVEALAAFLRASRKAPLEVTREAFNAFLIRPDVIDAWSLPLASVSPAHGDYREIAFEYH